MHGSLLVTDHAMSSVMSVVFRAGRGAWRRQLRGRSYPGGGVREARALTSCLACLPGEGEVSVSSTYCNSSIELAYLLHKYSGNYHKKVYAQIFYEQTILIAINSIPNPGGEYYTLQEEHAVSVPPGGAELRVSKPVSARSHVPRRRQPECCSQKGWLAECRL
ncbi:hypothetical protein E2C01_001207 [Portunus trituberculatus]|uniref:Uncharacterized protein n=1 Tax=Portunus trituberculatus TaxID=210409 RepID=A0A5B7CHE0_PORTR|nr:hypothetical protein [Portunus trituberculatus]